MKTKLLIVLAMMTTSALIASCRESANTSPQANITEMPAPNVNEPQQKPPPQPTTEREFRKGHTPFEDWTTHSPVRETMRRFWVDMGLIIANSARPETAVLEFVDSPAADIERRARRIADFWKAIRDRANEGYRKAKLDDWDGALVEIDELHHECGNCHYEYWSQGARMFIPATLKGWKENGTPFGDEPWADKQIFVAPEKVSKGMRYLRDNMSASFDAINEESITKLHKFAGKLREKADDNFKVFDSIARSAKQIQNAVESGNLAGIKEHYDKIAAVCMDCHAKQAPTTSLPPLPYPAARNE